MDNPLLKNALSLILYYSSSQRKKEINMKQIKEYPNYSVTEDGRVLS